VQSQPSSSYTVEYQREELRVERSRDRESIDGHDTM
jgi:hypothetical protein